jgi:Ca2+-binding RTX toxin-like protein
MRDRDRARSLLAGATAAFGIVLLAGVAVGSHRHTYAQYSDFADAPASARAGVWTPDPPARCGPLSDYSAIVYGTDGDDTIIGRQGATHVVELKNGGNREIIMGLGGDDHLSSGNGKDCIVGGPGNDMLSGDNGKDVLLGGSGTDECVGGNAPDDIQGCESGFAPHPARLPQQLTGPQPTDSTTP